MLISIIGESEKPAQLQITCVLLLDIDAYKLDDLSCQVAYRGRALIGTSRKYIRPGCTMRVRDVEL